MVVRLTTTLGAGVCVRCGAPPTPRRQPPRTRDGRALARGVVSRARRVDNRGNAASGEGEDSRPTVALGVVVEGINDVKAVHAAVRATEVHSLNGYGALHSGFRLAGHAHAELAQLKARHAQLVVLTDPDVSGRHLRETLERQLGPLLYVCAYSVQGMWGVCGRTHSQHFHQRAADHECSCAGAGERPDWRRGRACTHRHAFVSADDATASVHNRGGRRKRMGNVGVEHAAPGAIVGALAGARAVDKGRREVEAGQLRERGLMAAVEDPMDSRRMWVAYGGVKERRRQLGRMLGIGEVDGKTLLRTLNAYGFSLQEVDAAVAAIPLKPPPPPQTTPWS